MLFLVASFYFLFKEIIQKFDRHSLLLVVVVQLITLVIFVPNLAVSEFWGDEIGVIDFANYQFKQISDASSQHAAVPPFDYWMLHVVIRFFDFFETGSLYNEVLYRLPYFVIHSISSLYFGLLAHHLLKKHKFANFFLFKKKTIQEHAILVIASLFFFFNPLLLFYGLEVRYYATTILGIVVTLYYVLTENVYSLRFFTLTLLFFINSVFHFVFMAPILLYLLSKKRIEFVVFSLFVGAIFLQVEPRFDYMEVYSISSSESLEKIQVAFIEFHHHILKNWAHAVTLISIAVLALLNKKAAKKNWLFLGMIIYLFLAVAIPSYQKRYFDFHLRHFLVISPFYLLAYFYPFLLLKSDRYKKIYGFWLVFLIVLWVGGIFFGRYPFVQKTNLGARKILEHTKFNETLIVYFEPAGDGQLLAFNRFAYDWYEEEFGYKSMTVISEEQLCERPCFDSDKCVVVTGTRPISCLDEASDFYVEETQYGYHYYSKSLFASP